MRVILSRHCRTGRLRRPRRILQRRSTSELATWKEAESSQKGGTTGSGGGCYPAPSFSSSASPLQSGTCVARCLRCESPNIPRSPTTVAHQRYLPEPTEAGSISIGIYGPQPTAQVAISGGEIAQVPVALPLPRIKDVSPDGSTLLVTSYDGGQGSLWNVEVPAGSLRRLLTDAWVDSAAWSPDGKSVVYSPGDGDLDVIRSDGTGTRKLAAVGGLPGALSWSPDGSKIRFSRDNRLWEMSSDGSGLHPLLPGWRPSSSQCCGRWTPDGKFFVFLSRGAFFSYSGLLPASQLWVLDERRGLFRRAPTEPVQLTSGPIRWNTPIPSKDGTKIFAHGVILRGELVRYDAQSSRLQPWLGGISAEFVTFSPDGQFVAYVTFPEGILWRANRDGSHPVQLTDAPLYPLNPRWSPDGSQILFCSYDSEGRVRSLRHFLPGRYSAAPSPGRQARDRAIRAGLLTDTRLSFLRWKQ